MKIVFTVPAEVVLESSPLMSPVPRPDYNAVVVDLGQYPLDSPSPGWSGGIVTPDTRFTDGKSTFPVERDLVIFGSREGVRTGTNRFKGGRNMFVYGGAYTGGWRRDHARGDTVYEGVLLRKEGYGDGLNVYPSRAYKDRERTRFFAINCRVENIDGALYADSTKTSQGPHGDIFQSPSNYFDGFDSWSLDEVWIERFTGSTGYQGFFFPVQSFGSSIGYGTYPSVHIRDVNLKKTRQGIQQWPGAPEGTGGISLIYTFDNYGSRYSNRPFPISMTNFHLEPFSTEGLIDLVNPTKLTYEGGIPAAPSISADGMQATWDVRTLITGFATKGAPPGGDFAKSAAPDGRGGFDVPGAGYISPFWFWPPNAH